MQVFAEGRGTGWNKIYFTVEYETTRSGVNVGIRWKIKWAINSTAWYGYNLVADVWTKGANYGRQIKANMPNRGSGQALFPEDGGWFWFNNGYTNNDITGCRVIVRTTNGGTVSFDTGTDKTLTAPTRYTTIIYIK